MTKCSAYDLPGLDGLEAHGGSALCQNKATHGPHCREHFEAYGIMEMPPPHHRKTKKTRQIAGDPTWAM